jgi:hypothetical protein
METHRKLWNEQQQALRKALNEPAEFSHALDLFGSQHAMLHSTLAAQAGLWSFEDEAWGGLDDDLARIIPPRGEHSIAWMLWHLARIEDLTMSILLAGVPQLFDQEGWFERMQISYRDTGNAMNPAEIATLSAEINIRALRQYRQAVGNRTKQFVHQLTPTDFKKKVVPERLVQVTGVGGVIPQAAGLLDYWAGLTLAGLLLMPPTRHNFIHLNEAARLRKAL